jgi:hypothetical protein
MFMVIEYREECGAGRFAPLFLYTHPHIIFFQCVYIYCCIKKPLPGNVPKHLLPQNYRGPQENTVIERFTEYVLACENKMGVID